MSLEQTLERIATALEAIASKAGAAPAADKPAADKKPAASKPAAEKKPAASKKPKHSRDEVNAALVELKDTYGMEYAKEILQERDIAKMADIPEAQFDEIYDAAKAKIEELGEGGSSEDGEGL